MNKNKINFKNAIQTGMVSAIIGMIAQVAQIVLYLYILTLGLIYINGSSKLTIILVPKKEQLINNLPIGGDFLVTHMHLVLGFFLLLILGSYFVVKVYTKVGEVIFQVLLIFVAVLGITINIKIQENINKIIDVIYESEWFRILKIYTLDEKKAYYMQQLKEKCIENDIPYNKGDISITDEILNLKTIEEIKFLIETQYKRNKEHYINSLLKGTSEQTLWDSIPLEKIVLGLVVIGVFCYIGYALTNYIGVSDQVTKEVMSKVPHVAELTEKLNKVTEDLDKVTMYTKKLIIQSHNVMKHVDNLNERSDNHKQCLQETLKYLSHMQKNSVYLTAHTNNMLGHIQGSFTKIKQEFCSNWHYTQTLGEHIGYKTPPVTAPGVLVTDAGRVLSKVIVAHSSELMNAQLETATQLLL